MAKNDAQKFLGLLAPFAPYMTEELYQTLFITGEAKKTNSKKAKFSSIHRSSWPVFSEELTKDSMLEIAVQVNGKFKMAVLLEAEKVILDKQLEKQVLNHPKVQSLLGGKTITKTIVVPNRLVNFIVE